MKKWLAEGTREEIKTVLGWRIDTRIFLVALPQDKSKAYGLQVEEVLKANKVEQKTLSQSLDDSNVLLMQFQMQNSSPIELDI